MMTHNVSSKSSENDHRIRRKSIDSESVWEMICFTYIYKTFDYTINMTMLRLLINITCLYAKIQGYMRRFYKRCFYFIQFKFQFNSVSVLIPKLEKERQSYQHICLNVFHWYIVEYSIIQKLIEISLFVIITRRELVEAATMLILFLQSSLNGE